jgi:hypothetical protein
LELSVGLRTGTTTFPTSSYSASHPRTVPPMSHPVMSPWPNIAPKVCGKEGAVLCLTPWP